MNFFHTTEFYVILFITAAFVVAMFALPRGLSEVKELLIGSKLSEDGSDQPSVSVSCQEGGKVTVTRHGLQGIPMTGAVSAKLTIKGNSLTISERLVEGNISLAGIEQPMAVEATFEIDNLGSDRYYLRYESEPTSSAATLTFRNIPGYHAGPSPLKT